MPLGAAETLASYRAQTRRLLHDANGDYWSDADLLVDINKAIRKRDVWTSGPRAYKSDVPLTVGQDTYSFATLFPTDTVLDVVNLWLIYGNTRVLLDNPPFGDLTDKYRSVRGLSNRPGGFARYGANQVFIAPAPGAAYTSDWDLVVLSCVLANDADPDPLPFPYTEPVAYYAAYQALLNAREFDKADVQFNYFVRECREIEGARVGTLVASGQR